MMGRGAPRIGDFERGSRLGERERGEGDEEVRGIVISAPRFAKRPQPLLAAVADAYLRGQRARG